MVNKNPRQVRVDQKWRVVWYADGYDPDCDG